MYGCVCARVCAVLCSAVMGGDGQELSVPMCCVCRTIFAEGMHSRMLQENACGFFDAPTHPMYMLYSDPMLASLSAFASPGCATRKQRKRWSSCGSDWHA